MKDIKHNSFLPQKLTDKEAANPHQVIADFFDFAHLPEVREILWDWLKITVTGGFGKDMRIGERRDLLYFYELLQKLVEAAHVIHRSKVDIEGQGATVPQWDEED
ncbi:MAG: hypothetical protein JWN76_3388 [Chitinophagaceae bacterium]|nr:hypothetical protein [Chitinophagaceae bacterium]